RALDISEHEVDVVAVRVLREARSTAARTFNECRIAELAEEAVFGGRAQRRRLRQAFLHQLADARAIAAEANRIKSGNTVELGKIRSRENGDVTVSLNILNQRRIARSFSAAAAAAIVRQRVLRSHKQVV